MVIRAGYRINFFFPFFLSFFLSYGIIGILDFREFCNSSRRINLIFFIIYRLIRIARVVLTF